ncbi:uncharacterized protein N7498_001174 [Penicillium cinerascens]|uniref:Uncharacterized protein n=1 Tax=Penicillium cinerascens TaxID=70096 RepID=A0A9W9NFM3_9EURO|nr:uncharacterized protein N7498_001174 [Penicillium cinerascens]KAJ5219075.1 hypothetical protein N7498_001174 [Penicillium cinerascens]
MEQPVSEPLSGENGRPLAEVQRQVSDQLDRELRQDKINEHDQSLYRQQTVSLSISPNYVKQWDTTAAFRELYQNWKDAILERFQVERRDFQPCYENKRDCISIIVPDASGPHGRGQALGFIKYEKKAERVILANSCASLRPDDLQFRQTSKEGSHYLAGCRGEGLKLAAMVMSRNGYKVHIAAGGCDWSFRAPGPSRSQFSCVIRPSRNATSSLHTDPTSDIAQLRSHIERDVTITIGPERNRKRDKISLELFKKWLGATLDIRGFSYPSHIIETKAGDIILDASFHGKVFYKGMLLSGPVSETESFRLGYNFLAGTVNRDRQRLVDKQEEANIVRRI